MKQEWVPAGLDMKGFVHSHPGGYARLSGGDLEYAGRLLAKNPDLAFFAAPIVLPESLRLCPIVVLPQEPTIQRPTTLQLF
jgi:proteasome lid subunit RPN8/RPN11